MDDVIVIILTLVLTIVAAINQQKKRKKQAPSDEEGEPDFWEEVFQGGKTEPRPENAGRPVTMQPAPKPEPTDRNRQQKQPLRVAAVQNRVNLPAEPKEGERNLEVLKYTTGAKGFGSDLSAEEPAESLLDDFSLKKAVIYNEIIQPKYF